MPAIAKQELVWHGFSLARLIKLLNMKPQLALKRSVLVMATVFMAALASAQDQIGVDINARDSGWSSSPWLWVVGAAVFILLLAALMRGGSQQDA